jgi:AAA domain
VTDDLDRAVADVQTKLRERVLLEVEPYKVSRERARSEETGWMIRGRWPADAYGVMGAEDKAGKTWAVLDLAVSVVGGTALFGSLPVEGQGPVTLFLGEGGRRGMVRRLDAIATFHGADPDLDGLRVCYRVPRLTSREHLAALTGELELYPPRRLVVVDPLYLAAAGARGSDLYAMGEHLQEIQLICQRAKAALVVTTHWNKTGDGSGASRFTGVGPGAWGRVLASAAVEQRRVEAGSSTVLLRWEFTGREIADSTVRVRRSIWAEGGGLDAPLHYVVEVTEKLDGLDDRRSGSELTHNQERALAALRGATRDDAVSTAEVQDTVANDGKGYPLKTSTVRKLLNELTDKGIVDGADDGEGTAKRWWPT